MGEEARTFLEILILIGMGKSQLSDQSLKVIKRVDSDRRIKIFVSPTCPYCPQQAINAVKTAIEMPQRVSLEIVDIQSEPELADQYSAQSVPQAFANDVLIGLGAQSEEVFAASRVTRISEYRSIESRRVFAFARYWFAVPARCASNSSSSALSRFTTADSNSPAS